MKKTFKVIIIIIILIIAFFVIGFYQGTKIIEKTYNINSDKISQDYTIVQISDFHSMKDEARIAQVNEIIATQEVDLFAITGDYIDEGDYQEELQYLKDLNEIAPVYYTNGNHDNDGGEYNAFIDDLEANGIHVVVDDSIMFNAEINVIGTESNFSSTLQKLDENDAYYNQVIINDAITFEDNISDEMFNLVLAHNPAYFDGYCAAAPDLVLTGHTHGGLWRVPFLNISAIAPEQGFFPKYDAGLFTCNDGNTQMIISTGLEETSNGVRRLYNPAEVVVINLMVSK